MALTPEQFEERKRQLIEEERKNPPGWWYLSFANDSGFLGAAIVQGQGPATAIDRSWRLKINPGDCEVCALQIEQEDMARTPAEAREKFLTMADIERFLGPVERVMVGGGDVN